MLPDVNDCPLYSAHRRPNRALCPWYISPQVEMQQVSADWIKKFSDSDKFAWLRPVDITFIHTQLMAQELRDLRIDQPRPPGGPKAQVTYMIYHIPFIENLADVRVVH